MRAIFGWNSSFAWSMYWLAHFAYVVATLRATGRLGVYVDFGGGWVAERAYPRWRRATWRTVTLTTRTLAGVVTTETMND